MVSASGIAVVCMVGAVETGCRSWPPSVFELASDLEH